MDITQTKFTLKNLRRRRSILIEGVHGTGKSQTVAQVCKELSIETKIPHILIDVRLSQREEGDIIGVPRGLTTYSGYVPTYVDGKFVRQAVEMTNVMVHDVPVWFPRDPGMYGTLLYDELPYATKGVVQAVMESLLDHSQNGVPIPENVRVVACGNSGGNLQDIYGGCQMNPAVYDRPLKIEFQPTFTEWAAFAREHGVHPAILFFLTKFQTKLDPPAEMESGKAYPSRRSWVTLGEDIQDLAKVPGFDPFKDLDYLGKLVKGRVGSVVAVDFMNWVKSNFKLYSAEEILNKWDAEMEKDFRALTAEEVTFYNDELIAHIKKTGKKLTGKQKTNLERYVRVVPKETASAFFVSWLKDTRDIAIDFYSIPTVRDYLFGNMNMQESLGLN